MRKLRKLIHSPHHLFVFEAAARHGSFTRAAAELNVSQPAVSLAIRQLETAMGVTLFARVHRGVELTDAGRRFHLDVESGLGQILNSVELLSRRTAQAHVTLSASTAFANYWMVPRLAELRQAHADIDLRLQTTDRDLDLAQEGISLGIRRGTGGWPGYGSARVADERIFAVASPAYLKRIPAPRQLADLAVLPLIHLEEPIRPRPRWTDWFAGMGHGYRDDGGGLRLNDYALVLQAAMAGEGIAFGWAHIVEKLVGQGLLTTAWPTPWVTGQEFHVIWSERTPLSPHAVTVRDWILGHGVQTKPV